MLDPDNRNPAGVDVPDGSDKGLAFRLGKPAGDFVEKKEFGPCGERPRQFEALALQKREFAGRQVGLGCLLYTSPSPRDS